MLALLFFKTPKKSASIFFFSDFITKLPSFSFTDIPNVFAFSNISKNFHIFIVL
ncbi:Uncharacterised protein [Chryseobacterium carnipullorum]|uniref:Uncharacterized protein n=1 Tax=Chryseobacterium carnipullorum TaxID=1124835 RepID=A0A376DRK6_CHRCU|nr:Uncharacterised protein [Chryseobacterium carnipullorum]